MLTRATRLTAKVLAVAGVVSGAAAVTVMDREVDLTVDGSTSTVHAFGGSVADVLASQDITIGEHDLVSPSPDSAVHDGTAVVVRYARPLTVTTDGRESTHWTTALSVDEALNQIGVRDRSTHLSVSRSLPLGRTGLSLTAATRKKVTLKVGGKVIPRTTYSTTVAELLAEAKVRTNPLDTVSATRSTRLSDGAGVTVTRRLRKPVSVPVALPFATTKVEDDDLAVGTTKVKTQGKPGVARASFVETWVDGRRTERAATGRTVVTKPVAQVVLVGTKPEPKPDDSAIPSSGGLNWASLARCESGGDPQAVNANGHYGLYQFSLQTWRGVGGSGNPVDASVAEQSRRAQILYDRAGASQWSCGNHLFD